MLLKKFRETNNNSIIKLGNSTFIDKTSVDLPLNIRNAISEHKFTSVNNMIPLAFFMSDLNLYMFEVNELLKTNYFKKIIKIENKKMLVLNDEYAKEMRKSQWYILNNDDLLSCIENDEISNYIKIKNKYLVWYNTEPYSSQINTNF
jgi:hypothetical protein